MLYSGSLSSGFTRVYIYQKKKKNPKINKKKTWGKELLCPGYSVLILPSSKWAERTELTSCPQVTKLVNGRRKDQNSGFQMPII